MKMNHGATINPDNRATPAIASLRVGAFSVR